MAPHHRETLDAAIAHFRSDPNVLAVLLGGSIAKGVETPQSDVDVIIVLTPEAYLAKKQNRGYAQVLSNLATYEGGYVDVKFVDRAFIEAAADHGSEPTRDSFTGVQVTWSSTPDLDQLIVQISVYPESERETKMRRFYSGVSSKPFSSRRLRRDTTHS